MIQVVILKSVIMMEENVSFKKKPKVTKENLKANAVNGSLLSIIGLVVMNAEDHKIINRKGKILIMLSNKQINKPKSNKYL